MPADLTVLAHAKGMVRDFAFTGPEPLAHLAVLLEDGTISVFSQVEGGKGECLLVY
jgi:hypothetical protein